MTIRAFLQKECIDVYALLPFSVLRVGDEARLCRFFGEKRPQTALIFLIPYYVKGFSPNFSRYAASRDYHLYIKELEARAKACFPSLICAAADHSPVDERHAALVASLGVLGENRLVLNEDYGSFCFIGELFFENVPEGLAVQEPAEIRGCASCHACKKACPGGALGGQGACLSEISQKKRLTEDEARLLAETQTLWGCDVCQNVCPYNRNAKETPISFFREDLVSRLDEQTLDALVESGEFSRRAFSWRGEETLRRNVRELSRRAAKKGE
ncbi:MAG: epoxyqueuosine reductase [Clostridia bacterium]|nr:epoxyqueuosine reductase [Clostridia bacterium]